MKKYERRAIRRTRASQNALVRHKRQQDMIPLKPSIHDLQAEIQGLKKKLTERDLLIRRAMEFFKQMLSDMGHAPHKGPCACTDCDRFSEAKLLASHIDRLLKK